MNFIARGSIFSLFVLHGRNKHKTGSEYISQSTTNKMQRFSNLFISVRRSTCFRRFFCPSSGATKLHTQCQAFVRLLLLPAASLDGMELVYQFQPMELVSLLLPAANLDGMELVNQFHPIQASSR